jgi:hypothetical protein
MAINAHQYGTDAHLIAEALSKSGANYLRVIDLDVDIGADAIDYK